MLFQKTKSTDVLSSAVRHHLKVTWSFTTASNSVYVLFYYFANKFIMKMNMLLLMFFQQIQWAKKINYRWPFLLVTFIIVDFWKETQFLNRISYRFSNLLTKADRTHDHSSHTVCSLWMLNTVRKIVINQNHRLELDVVYSLFI